MRVTPTQEQIEHLLRIGVSPDTFYQSHPVEPPPNPDSGHVIPQNVISVWHRVCCSYLIKISVLVLILSILLLYHITSGQETAPTLTQNPASIEATKKAQPESPKVTPFESKAAQLEKESEKRLKNMVGLSETGDSTVLNEALSARLSALDRALSKLTRAFVIALICAPFLVASLLLIGRFAMERKTKQVEARVFQHLLERPSYLNTYSEADGRKEPDKIRLPVHPERPLTEPVSHPSVKMLEIVERARVASHLRVKPEIPGGLWNLGLATGKGNVRSENQDYGLCFEIGGHQVMIVADGCGGVPRGQAAAQLSAGAAAVSIVRTYGRATRWSTPDPTAAAAMAMRDASHRLTVEGDKLNITGLRDGLRTTLIIVVADRRKYGYAYIGDGGGYIVRSLGTPVQFLIPQKADKDVMNVLAASLGPTMEGEPVMGEIPRLAGDLLLIGTDGVFDRVDGSFPKDVLRGAIYHYGDLQQVAEVVLNEMAEFKDSNGYLCDDNMTLGLMGDRTQPRLAADFWDAESFGKQKPSTES